MPRLPIRAGAGTSTASRHTWPAMTSRDRPRARARFISICCCCFSAPSLTSLSKEFLVNFACLNGCVDGVESTQGSYWSEITP